VNSGGKNEIDDLDISRVDNMDNARGSSITECIKGRHFRTAPAFHECDFGGNINSTVVFMVSSQIYYPPFGFFRTLENGWAVIYGDSNLDRLCVCYATVFRIHTRAMDFLFTTHDRYLLDNRDCVRARVITPLCL